MLKRLIRAIRRKPKAVRDQYALWIAVSLTAMVVFFWVMSFSGDISLVDESAPRESVSAERESFSDMFSGLRDDLGELTAGSQSTTSAETAVDATISTGTASQTEVVAAPAVDSTYSQPEVRIATFTATSASTIE